METFTDRLARRVRRQRRDGTTGSKRLARRAISSVMLVLLVGILTGAGGFVAGYQVLSSQRHEDLEDLENYETLIEVYDLIREQYVASDNVTDDELIYGAAKGMVEALGDEDHSVFLTPDEVEEREESRASGYVGIGIYIDIEVIPPRVIEPVPNSPALEAGILPGDEILAVDGVPYDLLDTTDDFLNLISGEEGTDVVIELRHLGEADSYTVTITRAQIANVTVSWAMLPDNVMWLRVRAFNEGTGDEVIAALQEGKAAGAEAVVLDLRDNGGGLIVEEMLVQGQFLEAGTTAFIGQDRDGNTIDYEIDAEEGEWREGPLVVLINGRTVSAAESTAASLAANDRAITIGETTFGTGTSLATFDLDDGSNLVLGVELWLTPDGESIWLEGLDPMIEVVNDPGAMMMYPQMYEVQEITEDLFAASDDAQLTAGHEEVLSQLNEG